MNRLTSFFATVLPISIIGATVCHIWELWLLDETLLFKFKWTFCTLALSSLVMGLLLSAGIRAADKAEATKKGTT